MTSPNSVGLGGSTAWNIPQGGGATEPWGPTATSPSCARKSSDGRAIQAGMSTYKFGLQVAVKPRAPQGVEQVKAFATSYVEQCWKD